MHCISLVVWYMPFNNDGLLVTSKLCTYYSAVGSTEFACAWLSCRNIPYTALKASARLAREADICFDRCMYYPAENMQNDAVKKVS